MTRCYLAGPIRNAADSGRGWRGRVENYYRDFGIEWVNPLNECDVAVDDVEIVDGRADESDRIGVETLVERDKALVDSCDAVLIGHSGVRQVGTPMEALYAYERDIPVVMWARDAAAPAGVSPWYRYHCDVVTDNLTAGIRAVQNLTGANND